jgi:DNA-binding winged helix-turn-helix (wHTH) protein
MQSSPKVVSHQDIEHALWDDEPPDSGALRSHMYALRRTVDKPFSQSLLTTVHGIGYRLVEPHDEIPS